jgi:MFS family permease
MGSSANTAARKALALLLVINLFNYIDRQMLAAVVPKIEAEFHKSKGELGLLLSMFLISYTVAAPIFGWLGDRYSRWKLIAVGVVLWSLASGGTGLATTFAVLMFTRGLIGVGEAAYGPAAPSLISDLFPVDRRGGVLAWFYMAIPVGSALGYVLGGAMSDTALGWRWAFYLVVPPGVLLGLLCLMMPEPKRGAADAGEHRLPTLRDTKILFRIPSYVLNTLGMTAMTFSLGAIAAWMPTYLYEREGTYGLTPAAIDKARTPEHESDRVPDETLDKLQPMHGKSFQTMEAFRGELEQQLSPPEAEKFRAALREAARDEKAASLGYLSMMFGATTALAGLLATLSGGYLGDFLRRRGWHGSYFLISGIGMFIALPLFLLSLVAPLPLGWVVIFFGVFFIFFNTGPTNTALANVTPPALRASAFALNIFIIHCCGDVFSPYIVGTIDDHSSLRAGLLFLAAPIGLAGVFWLWAARYLKRDTERAPTLLSSCPQ